MQVKTNAQNDGPSIKLFKRVCVSGNFIGGVR